MIIGNLFDVSYLSGFIQRRSCSKPTTSVGQSPL